MHLKLTHGQCTITFDNAEEKVTLAILKVPAKAGLAFEEFSRQIAVWIEKLEERRAKAEAAAVELTVGTGEARKMDLGDAEGSAPDEPIFPTRL